MGQELVNWVGVATGGWRAGAEAVRGQLPRQGPMRKGVLPRLVSTR